eukprot:1761027-Rhodomonas_salina.1
MAGAFAGHRRCRQPNPLLRCPQAQHPRRHARARVAAQQERTLADPPLVAAHDPPDRGPRRLGAAAAHVERQ